MNIFLKNCTEFEKLYGCQVCHYLLVQVFLFLRDSKPKSTFFLVPGNFYFLLIYIYFTVI